MPKPKHITVTSIVSRHHPQFSRLVTIPLDAVAPWKLSDTTVVEGTINDTELGRRSMKRWDDRNCWWIDLPEPLCKKAKLETGDEVTLKIRLASEDLPDELNELLAKSSTAKTNWEKLTKAQQRMLREEILASKSSETRSRRAKKALLPA
ncbi:MAG TPA: YdeI/OmpD-associated family protein [Pyrinomonadaceae bacterium]|nr:YdeI/OmpD-associated family protein [Pyrinomonadaceae bacterium]